MKKIAPIIFILTFCLSFQVLASAGTTLVWDKGPVTPVAATDIYGTGTSISNSVDTGSVTPKYSVSGAETAIVVIVDTGSVDTSMSKEGMD